MESRSIQRYIHVGTNLRYLHGVKKGLPIHGDIYVLAGISQFLTEMEDSKLWVTLEVAREQLAPIENELKATAPNASLTEDQVLRLQHAMGTIQKTLYAEAGRQTAYIVSEKRYDAERLLHDVGSLFAPHVYDSLPEIAKYDFAEAGICIAFERPTAAAFHLMRATEDVLRAFYCQRVKRNRVKPLLWFPMTEALKKLSKPPPLVLTNDLDNIRLQFRNPTQHPEKIYDIEEVQDLLGRCIDVVNRMLQPAKA